MIDSERFETDGIIFIYEKNKSIKVLTYLQSLKFHKELLREGWVHTSTINACLFIEYLHNDCSSEDLKQEVSNLSKGD